MFSQTPHCCTIYWYGERQLLRSLWHTILAVFTAILSTSWHDLLICVARRHQDERLAHWRQQVASERYGMCSAKCSNDVSGCTWAMTPVLGDPNVTAFLKALTLHRFCSTCTPTTCLLHVAENLFMLTTYVSPYKANSSANWNAVSCQIWRGCHTFVDSGDLNQAPPKQSAVCSTCIIPAPPVNCQFILVLWRFQYSETRFGFGFLIPKNRRTVRFN